MASPKYLVLNDTDGPVWPWTELLEKRGDMVAATAAQVRAWNDKIPFGLPGALIEPDEDGQTADQVDVLSITDKDQLRTIAKERGIVLPANATLKAMQDALKA